MRPLIIIAGAAGLALVLASCGGAGPQATLQSIAYGDPAKTYLGMTKDEIIACAGEPHSRYGSGEGTRR